MFYDIFVEIFSYISGTVLIQLSGHVGQDFSVKMSG